MQTNDSISSEQPATVRARAVTAPAHTPLARAHTLDLHRMHDGVWCALVLPKSQKWAVGRAFAHTPMQAARAAIKQARGS